jgi:hypothetical protein
MSTAVFKTKPYNVSLITSAKEKIQKQTTPEVS